MKKILSCLILSISIPLFGQIKFEDVTEKAGLVEPLKGIAGHCAVFGDANGDDYPELYVGTFTHFEDSVYNQRGHTIEAGFPAGFQKGLYGLGGFVDDINNDTWPDVFFSHSCRLFINNRNGTFRELPFTMPDPKYTLPSNINKDYAYYCGANTGDLDNDGDIDFVVGDHLQFEEANHRLFVFQNQGNDNDGNPVFKDITQEANIGNFGGRAIYIQIADIDNDGKMDICTSRYKNFIYKNTGVEKGMPKFAQPFDAGSDAKLMNYWAGGSFADFDRDGKLDFFGPEWFPEDKARLLRNVSLNAENYIDVKLSLAKAPNGNGIGAKVEIFKAGSSEKPEDRLGTHIISVANGYASGYEAIAHFGLPDDEKIDIRVTMPCNGPVYTARKVERNQLFKLKK